ncbi:MAG TPA: hypothetical protein VHN14_25985 [Kofleriaceae bacterium]|nr:hypothetical protein [Kofleriaceae bacterium]
MPGEAGQFTPPRVASRGVRSTKNARRAGLVLSAMLVATIAIGRDAHAGPARLAAPVVKANRSMSYDRAVALLQIPGRWCDGAAALARLGDRRAIGPLHRVVARTEEGLPDRGCVYDALDKLGVRDEVAKLVASTEVKDRRTGIALIRACPAPGHAPLLAQVALHDPEPALRSLAARTLRVQKVTAAWDMAMIALLDALDSETRELAATSLQHRFGAAILAALHKRLKAEPHTAVRAALAAAIQCQEDHATARP